MANRSSPSDPRLWADSIVNRLFSVGLELNAARRGDDGVDRERLSNAIHDLDGTIRDIHMVLLPQVVDHNGLGTDGPVTRGTDEAG